MIDFTYNSLKIALDHTQQTSSNYTQWWLDPKNEVRICIRFALYNVGLHVHIFEERLKVQKIYKHLAFMAFRG